MRWLSSSVHRPVLVVMSPLYPHHLFPSDNPQFCVVKKSVSWFVSFVSFFFLLLFVLFLDFHMSEIICYWPFPD